MSRNKIEVSELIKIYLQLDLGNQRFDLWDKAYFKIQFEKLSKLEKRA